LNLLLLCAGVALALMAIAILVRERGSWLGWLHFFLSVGLATWTLGLQWGLGAPDSASAEAVFRFVAIPAILAFLPVLFQLMCALTVQRARVRPMIVVAWAASVALLAILWFTDGFITGMRDYAWGHLPAYGWGGWLLVAEVTVVVAASMVFCARLLMRSPKGGVSWHRARLLLLGLGVASFGAADFLPFFGVDMWPWGSFALALGNGVNVIVTWRYRLVEITPAFAAQRFMDTMSDGVVVLDQDGLVRLVNPAACQMLGYRAEEMLHREPAAGVGALLFGEQQSLPHFPHEGYVGRERQYETPSGSRRTLSASLSLMQEGGREPLAAVVTLRDITAAMAAQEQIHRLAYYDPLTNLPNRLLLKERFSQAMARAERARAQAAVLFLDLDRFKQVNDTLGHDAGDLLLKAVSERITACVRESDLVMRNADSAKDSTLARLGGDEFVLLLAPVERGEDAAKVARRILHALTQPFRLKGEADVMSGVSIGISMYPADGEDADTLMKKADLAMYHAKETGRNDFRLFDPAMNAQALKRIDVEAGVKRALMRGELLLSYDPQYGLDGRSLVGFEARVAWRDPIRGRVEAGDFMGVAEETGIAASIFDWSLEAVCTQVAAWASVGTKTPPVCLSATVSQIERSELLRDAAAMFASHGLQPAALRLCITDLADPRASAEVLLRLRDLDALGVAIDLDSLGSGPLDLQMLRQVPARRARVDARLLERLTVRGDPKRPLLALVRLAQGLGLGITATSVASATLAEDLRAAGVDQAQGPFFGGPVEADRVPGIVAAAPIG